ncbi:MAG: hypothetical protein ABR616_19620 [Dermatophilaceae bacterium]
MDEPLLDDQAEDESRLPVAHGPLSRADGGCLGLRAADPGLDDRAEVPAPVKADSVEHPSPTRGGQGDVDVLCGEAPEPCHDEGAHAIESRARPALPHRMLQPSPLREGRADGDADRVPPEHGPSSGPDLRADVGARDADRPQAIPVGDAVVGRRDVCSAARPVGTRQTSATLTHTIQRWWRR